MTLIDELFDIERQSYNSSPIHSLDARVKLIVCLIGLLATVLLPYQLVGSSVIPWAELISLAVIYMLFWMLYFLSGTPLRYYFVRLVILIPFGMFFILLQPFFGNPYYDVYHVLVSLPFGITIYVESLIFAATLFLKFIISLSFIILLSATTTMQKMVEGAARLHVPRLFVSVLSLTVRYIFVFGLIFQKIMSAFSARSFSAVSRKLPLKYRLNVIGNAAGSLFIRALDQGERTYTAMCCRGYVADSSVYFAKKPLAAFEWVFLAAGIFYLLLFPLLVYLVF